jgi:hypothetical protein
MKWLLFFAVFSLLATMIYSQENKRKYNAVRTVERPEIDGIIEDKCWTGAESATGMFQYTPDEGKKATKETEVKVIYDDNAIYVYAMLFDNTSDSICTELGVRDNSGTYADGFYIGFIPYNLLDAYVFGVTASGVQIDYRDSDPTYDAVWESSVKINSKGWAVEMKIPYSAIRFPSAQNQSWGFQFTRTIKRTGEYDQWALTPKTASNSRLYWGVINGISNIKSPVRLSMTPFISGYFENSPQVNNGSVKYYNLFSYNFGADLKYGLDEKFTLDITLLPDFNQVQSDNKVKNLSYNEVTYNENRSFFKEGTELFSQNSLFYSRRIGQTPAGYYSIEGDLNNGDVIVENPSKARLLNAIKLSGRNNKGTGVGVLNAITDNTYAVAQDSAGNRRKTLTEPFTDFNIIVIDRQLKNNSSFYLINTNVIRTKKYQSANVTGSGFTLFNKDNSYAIDGSAALSKKFTVNDSLHEKFNDLTGYKYFFGIRKSSGNLQFGFSHLIINKSFDSRDMGYYVISNKTNERLYFTYNTFKPNNYFRESSNSIQFDYGINPLTGRMITNQVNLNFYFTLHDYSNFNIGFLCTPFRAVDYNEPRVEGRYSATFRYYYIYSDYNSDVRKPLAIEFHIETGDFIEKFRGPAFGNQTGIRLRINNRMQMKYIFNYNIDTYNVGFAGFDDSNHDIYGKRKLSTLINSLTCQYLFSKDMSISFAARHYWNTGEYKRYYLLLDDGSYSEINDYTGNSDFNYNVFNIDMIFAWQFAPGSTASFVYKNAVESESSEIARSFSRNFSNTLDSPQLNSISLKILYYLDYWYFDKLKRHA